MRVRTKRIKVLPRKKRVPLQVSLLRPETAEGAVSYLLFDTLRDMSSCRWVPALNGTDRKVRRQLQ